jgi:hypothetical protein
MRGFGMEDMNFDDLGLLLRVIEIQWFSISLFMVFKSLCCMWHLHLLCEISYTPSLCLLAMWNCSCAHLIIIAYIIIALYYIFLLVRLDLFVASGVHRSDYTCFLCGLICSPLVECTDQIILASCAAWFVCRFVSQCFGDDPCLFRHGVRLQCRCDF